MKIISMNRMHIQGVAQLERDCFVHPWSENSLEEYLSNPSAYFFVCLDDNNQVVGYVGSYIICDEAYITNVAVSEHNRGCGIGKELVNTVCENAHRNGASFISLEVRPSNIPAVTLYKGCGFEVEGLRRKFYRDPEEDAFIMTKRNRSDFERG